MELPLPPDRRRQGPGPAPPQRPCMQREGGRARLARWYFAAQSKFPLSPSVLPSRARKAAWASSPVAGVGDGVLACRQMSPCNNSHLAPLLAGTLPHLVPLQVTGRRLWKNVYDELGGSPGSTSAATCTRRHYERCGRQFQDGPALPGCGAGVGGPGVYCGQGRGRMSSGVWGVCPAAQGSPGRQAGRGGPAAALPPEGCEAGGGTRGACGPASWWTCRSSAGWSSHTCGT